MTFITLTAKFSSPLLAQKEATHDNAMGDDPLCLLSGWSYTEIPDGRIRPPAFWRPAGQDNLVIPGRGALVPLSLVAPFRGAARE